MTERNNPTSNWTPDEQAIINAQLAGRFPGTLSSRFAVETYQRMREIVLSIADCCLDSCGEPASYAGAYRLGDRKIILHFCEIHFDETADDALDFDRADG